MTQTVGDKLPRFRFVVCHTAQLDEVIIGINLTATDLRAITTMGANIYAWS